MCDFSRDSPALAGRGRPAKRREVGRVRGTLRESICRDSPSPRPSYALGLAVDTRNLDMIQAWDEDSS